MQHCPANRTAECSEDRPQRQTRSASVGRSAYATWAERLGQCASLRASPNPHDHDPHRLRRGACRDGSRRDRLPARPPFRQHGARTGWPPWPRSSTSAWRRWRSELSAALERAQAESRRTRLLGELGGTIDLDEVLTRTLDAAGSARAESTPRSSPSASRATSPWSRRWVSAARPARTPRSPARRTDPAALDRDRVRVRPGRRNGRSRPDPGRPRRPAGRRWRADRLPRRLLPRGAARSARRGAAELEELARRAGPGDRQRAPLPRGAPARRSRRADRAAQPPLLPRDAGARGRARAPLQPQPRARRVRPRRLQGDQRPDRPSRRRRASWRRPPTASATSSGRRTSPAASAATSSR